MLKTKLFTDGTLPQTLLLIEERWEMMVEEMDHKMDCVLDFTKYLQIPQKQSKGSKAGPKNGPNKRLTDGQRAETGTPKLETQTGRLKNIRKN